MNNDEKTFVEMVKNGQCSIEDIDDYIDKWHDEYKGNLKLYEYLGMNEDEYNQWLTNPNSLKTMFHRELTPVYANQCDNIKIAKELIKLAKEIIS